MFLQIHTLTSYPASLLNRDEAGLAKRIPFGNASRLRVSSQCLKRHWRDELAALLSDIPDSLRTRSFFTRAVKPRLTDGGMDDATASALVQALAKGVIDGGVKDGGELAQPVLFGLREADYFAEIARVVAKGAASPEAAGKALAERLKSPDEKKNIAAMKASAAGLTAGLFGRMVTSDLLARVDAPVHVAHAFTVHAAAAEMDYFTVVDDLNRDDETGAAHANQSELAAGIYYGYVVVDVPLLVSNLTGFDRRDWRKQEATTPRRVLDALLRAIPSVSPGAKLGSTAPYSRAELVLLEAGTQQPRTLANAFLEAVDARNVTMPRAVDRMGKYLKRVDDMYGITSHERALATIHDAPAFGDLVPESLEGAIGRVLDAAFALPGA
ncbi:MAG: type I-E CRISPR-associated protein Cas7/Cse4/CasC [Rhodocyclaceae bacterium]|nr:type I-E CRISPR-associated protein Cas7/Cse4/CasC [Rhodocyclaceae bacterium]